jgi:hypothetical protein
MPSMLTDALMPSEGERAMLPFALAGLRVWLHHSPKNRHQDFLTHSIKAFAT